MSTLNFHLDNGDELCVPVAVLNPKLSPEEVASVLIFVAMAKGRMEEADRYLSKHDMAAASQSLISKKVLTITTSDGALKISVDLEAIA